MQTSMPLEALGSLGSGCPIDNFSLSGSTSSEYTKWQKNISGAWLGESHGEQPKLWFECALS
jgi:hypothetical protein